LIEKASRFDKIDHSPGKISGFDEPGMLETALKKTQIMYFAARAGNGFDRKKSDNTDRAKKKERIVKRKRQAE